MPKKNVCILSVSCCQYSICNRTRLSWYFWYLFNKIVEIYLKSSNPHFLQPIVFLVQYVCGIDWYRSASIFAGSVNGSFGADCCLSVFHYYHESINAKTTFTDTTECHYQRLFSYVQLEEVIRIDYFRSHSRMLVLLSCIAVVSAVVSCYRV